jgi:aspartate-semialdehyde dehydrogenase
MKRKDELQLALVGTDTLRGKEIKSLLGKKGLFFKNIEFFDPDIEEEYSKLTEFRGEPRVILPLKEEFLDSIDLVLLASDKKISKTCKYLAAKQDFMALDLSGTFNEDPKIPVVVAGINDKKVLAGKPQLIANPHPVTIILSHLLFTVISEFGLKKALFFVLQPASTFEESGIEELAHQSLDIMNGASVTKKVFKAQAAFNLLSQVEKVDENGFSSTERQVVHEIRRVLGKKELPISLAFVQAPVFHTYSIMSHIELEKESDIPKLIDVFKESSYFKFLPSSKACPVSSVMVAGKDEIHVSQIKKEDISPFGFWIWTVADNLTLGSALNAFEVAQGLSLQG